MSNYKILSCEREVAKFYSEACCRLRPRSDAERKNLVTSDRNNNNFLKFSQKVFEIVRKIPKGKVATYGDIARAIGTADSRRIGHILHQNKDSEKIPCHRVVFKDGSLAPGYVFGGPKAQRKKLEQEGVKFTTEGKVKMQDFRIISL